MSQVESPRLRAAFRTRDPAALGALLASQLLAYRCSTVYGPSPALVREVVDVHALGLLTQLHDVRSVQIQAWPAGGPSLAHVVAELLRQLELEPAGEAGDLVGLRQALNRAHRCSDRPLVIVLHDLGQLLDDDRDRVADRRLLDALAAAVELPIHGLQLVMTVGEHDLGAFRHLLRGRWRLLANDLRLHSDDRRMPLPLPILGPGAAAVASRTPLLAGLGLAGLGLAGAIFGLSQRGAADTARQQLATCQAAPAITCPEVQPAIVPVPEDIKPPPTPEPPPEPIPEPIPEPPPEPRLDTPPVEPTPVLAPKAKTCPARPGDGPCATCARTSCCSQLNACTSGAWKKCVLGGKVPSDECPPDAIEKDCRGLALCALEYQCNAVCYSK